MFDSELLHLAQSVLTEARRRRIHIVAAESCTGGLVTACLTEIPGSSDVVERGFITYSNQAKVDLLGVPAELIAAHGAVSEKVARAMATGALAHSSAQVGIAITGIAGPGGGSPEKPVGLVHIAAARDGAVLHEEHRFGELGRTAVRIKSVEAALRLLLRAVQER
jgi:nicotinamide-nucleotide amidase